jgi:hypothetical protein
MSDPADRLADAVRAIITDVERNMAPAIVEARGIERIRLLMDPNELPSQRIRRENAAALAEMAAIGNARAAAGRVADRWAPRDPHRRDMLAQRFRRLRRNLK